MKNPPHVQKWICHRVFIRICSIALISFLVTSSSYVTAQTLSSSPSSLSSSSHLTHTSSTHSFSSHHQTYFQSIQQWIPHDTNLIFGYQKLSFLNHLLHFILDYAPTDELKQSLHTLEEFHLGSLYPFGGLQKGVDPLRGWVWMKTKQGDVRLLISYQSQRDVEAFNETSALLSPFYLIQWDTKKKSTSEDGVLVSPHIPLDSATSNQTLPLETKHSTLTCTTHTHWIVCDQTQFSPPPQNTKVEYSWFKPEYITDPFWMLGRLSSVPIFPQKSVWTLGLNRVGDEIILKGEWMTALQPLLSALFAHHGTSHLLQWVHPQTPALFKLSVHYDDFIFYPHLIEAFPWLQELNRWIEHGWDGELILTFDGALDHPVLLVGLQNTPNAGQRLLLYWAKKWDMKFDPDSLSSSQLTQLRLVSNDSELSKSSSPLFVSNSWSIPVAHFETSLGIALFKTDLLRRFKQNQDGSQLSEPSLLTPSSSFSPFRFLQTKGASGFYIDPLLINHFSLPHASNTIKPTLLRDLFMELLKGEQREMVDLPVISPHTSTPLSISMVQFTHLLYWSQVLTSSPLPIWEQLLTQTHILNALYNFGLLLIKLTDFLELQIQSYLDQHTHFTFDLKWRPL